MLCNFINFSLFMNDISLLTLLFDLSMDTSLNRVIFYSIDSSLSLCLKNINFHNFSPQFIVQFDQI